MNIKYHWLVACFTVLLQLSENYPICQPMACDKPAVTEAATSTSRSEVSLWSTQYRYNLSVGHHRGSGVHFQSADISFKPPIFSPVPAKLLCVM